MFATLQPPGCLFVMLSLLAPALSDQYLSYSFSKIWSPPHCPVILLVCFQKASSEKGTEFNPE